MASIGVHEQHEDLQQSEEATLDQIRELCGFAQRHKPDSNTTFAYEINGDHRTSNDPAFVIITKVVVLAMAIVSGFHAGQPPDTPESVEGEKKLSLKCRKICGVMSWLTKCASYRSLIEQIPAVVCDMGMLHGHIRAIALWLYSTSGLTMQDEQIDAKRLGIFHTACDGIHVDDATRMITELSIKAARLWSKGWSSEALSVYKALDVSYKQTWKKSNIISQFMKDTIYKPDEESKKDEPPVMMKFRDSLYFVKGEPPF